jgi:hypothetical protein
MVVETCTARVLIFPHESALASMSLHPPVSAKIRLVFAKFPPVSTQICWPRFPPSFRLFPQKSALFPPVSAWSFPQKSALFPPVSAWRRRKQAETRRIFAEKAETRRISEIISKVRFRSYYPGQYPPSFRLFPLNPPCFRLVSACIRCFRKAETGGNRRKQGGNKAD